MYYFQRFIYITKGSKVREINIRQKRQRNGGMQIYRQRMQERGREKEREERRKKERDRQRERERKREKEIHYEPKKGKELFSFHFV